MTTDIFIDILKDSLIDAIKALPLLFLAYLVMEAVEHLNSEKMVQTLGNIGKAGPLVGALLGCIPQCGFSASASNLYAAGMITTGTLISVFLSTSDEALPLLLSSQGTSIILPLLVSKVIIGIIFGFALDVLIKKFGTPRKRHNICEHCGCNESDSILKPAIWHTFNILIFILILNIVLGCIIELLGTERISIILLNGSIFQPFAAAFIGLVPNCAVSVLLTKLYLAGSLSFGSLLAGLCSGAGLGLAVLLKSNHSKKENIHIVTILYLISALCGLVVQLIF